MAKPRYSRGNWNLIFFLIALLVVAADQLSKAWIKAVIPLGASMFDIGICRLTHVQNTGAAFGLFRGSPLPLTIMAFIGIIFILLYTLLIHRRYPVLDNRLSKAALGLILGGTIGNLIDRLYFGSVTDFIDFGYWPAFNIADSSIVVGVIIFAASLLFFTKTIK